MFTPRRDGGESGATALQSVHKGRPLRNPTAPPGGPAGRFGSSCTRSAQLRSGASSTCEIVLNSENVTCMASNSDPLVNFPMSTHRVQSKCMNQHVLLSGVCTMAKLSGDRELHRHKATQNPLQMCSCRYSVVQQEAHWMYMLR